MFILGKYFLASVEFIPHGHCYLWKPELVGLHIASDLLIALAYYSIPITLLYFVRKRQDLPFQGIFLLFGAFIVACGTSHLMEIWTLWHPTYWLSGFVKAITALISLYAAQALIPLVPLALALPSPAQLEAANGELECEIASRNLLEAALRESQARLTAILDNVGAYIYIKDTNSRFTYVNRLCGELFDLPQEEIIGADDFKVFSEEVALYFRESDRQAIESGLVVRSYDVWAAKSNGEARHYLTVKVPLKDSDGSIYAICGISTDITELKQTEEALRFSKARYRAILEDQTELIARFLPDGTLTFVNEAFCRFFDVTREAVINKNYQPVVVEEDREYVAQLVNTISKENPVVTIENRVIARGQVRWTQWINRGILDEGGKIVELQAVGRDISDRKQVEQALFESEKRLQLALEGSGDGLWDWNIATGELYLSPRYLEMLGYEADELPSALSTWEYLVHPDDKVWVKELLNAHLKDSSVSYAFDYRLLTKSGEWKWVADYGKVVVRDKQGKPLRMTGTHRDVSDRKRIEEALLKSEQRFRAIFDCAFQFVGLLQPDGILLEANQTALDFGGMSRDEAIGKPFWEAHWWTISSSTQEQLKAAIARAASGEFIRYEVEVWGRNNRILTIDFSLRPIFDELGRVTLLIPEGRDISDRKIVEAELQKAKEAAEAANRAKSAFLANMSHELRTPLNIILGYSKLTLDRESLSQEQRENLSIIHRSGEHLLALINQVLDLSKIEAARMTLNENNFNLYDLLADVEAMFSFKAREKRLQLGFERAATLPQHIRTDEVKLRQVLINLLGNAVKFTSEGGVLLKVGMGKGKREMGNGKETSNPPPLPLLFEIEDTGPGIGPEELDSLFEPFTQTKTGQQIQQGTGLGLAIARKFVQMMGGEIGVESELGVGTSFTFDILVSPVEAADIESKQDSRRVIALEPNQPRYRILIADDRADNRQLLIKLLSPLGFELREASNGLEAVEIWDAWEPHLIFMDVRMPIMDGCEATKQIKATAKGKVTAIVALTASTFQQEKAIILKAGCDDFIRKPFRSAEIFEIIHKQIGVRFAYEEPTQTDGSMPATDLNVLTTSAIAALPLDVVERLEQATLCVDMEFISDVIDEVWAVNPPLAEAIKHLVNDFNYEAVLNFIQQVKYQQ